MAKVDNTNYNTQWVTPSSGGSSDAINIYGDGSAGALTISSNTNWTTSPPASFNYQFSSITVNAGVTFTVPTGTKLRSSGSVTINGTINVAGAEPSTFAPGEKGVARNASGTIDVYSRAIAEASIPSLINIPLYGGSNGAYVITGGDNYGGSGGGTFAIYAKGAITIAGTINANGGNGITNNTGSNANGCGGGGGGIIVLLSKTSVTNSGALNAKGGNGSNGIVTSGVNDRPGGGGGGGGIVIFAAPTITQGTVSVSGGAGGANDNSGGSVNSSAAGAGGGCGGNGGSAGIAETGAPSITAPVPGSAGKIKLIQISNPENLY
ncbi:hypothetical protein D0T08_04935 [Emticicia sp. C21]|nr:hypothetical protein D0T08_04935 [Emticicia sp. C21]